MRAIDAEYLLYGMGMFSERENGAEFMKGVDAIAAMIEKAPTIVPRGWTPCSVALPEKDSLYIVTVRVCLLGATIIMTTVKGFDLKLGWSKSEYEDTVLAWQPLPEPYRGEA